MDRSPSPQRVLAYQAGLSLMVVAVSSVVLWAPQPLAGLIFGFAAGLMMIGAVFKPPISFIVTGTLVVFMSGT